MSEAGAPALGVYVHWKPDSGVLFALAGLGWLTFLSPSLATVLTPVTMSTGLVGEGSLGLWLLIKGVDVQRWREQASAAY